MRLTDETLFMSFYHDGPDPCQEGQDIIDFVKSRTGRGVREATDRQLYECQSYYASLTPAKMREEVNNKIFSLCTDPKFTYAAWRCSKSESPDIVGLTDMPQFQIAVNQILSLLGGLIEEQKK